MERNRVNLKAIAQKAGVDVSTVSRALNGSPRVKPDTRERIKELAEEMGYFPNALARGLVTSKSKTIGVVTPSIKNPYYASVLASAETVLTNAGYSLLLGVSHYSQKDELEIINLFLSRSVDGLILFSGEYSGIASLWKNATNSPMVLVDRRSDDHQVDIVTCDVTLGVKLVVDHLADLGHKRIAYITNTVTSEERTHAFHRFTAEKGLNCEGLFACTEERYEPGGYEGACELLKRKDRPTAIFCANDYMAIGAMKALKESGLSVPEDVSVVGFDDSTLLNYLFNSLTTVRQPKQQLGERAASILLGRLAGTDSVFYQQVVLTPELVIRNSTAAPG